MRRDLWSSAEARIDIAKYWLESPALPRIEIASAKFNAMSSGSSELQDYWSGHQSFSYSNTSVREIVTFFASNEDELLPDALNEDPYSMDTQSDAISWVIEQCLSKNLHVVIKEHPIPPSHGYRSDIHTIVREFRNHNSVDILDGHSKISSSSLINQSKFCITFGSSVGVQIIAAGKPLLILGPNILFSEEKVRRMWNQKQTFFDSPKDFLFKPADVYPFLYYCAKAGIRNQIRPPLA
jgi:hypothetical protein